MGIFGASIGEKKVMKRPLYRVSRDSELRTGSYGSEKVEHVYTWCSNCYGQGYFVSVDAGGNFGTPNGKCPTCEGSGKIWKEVGTGLVGDRRFLKTGIGGNVTIDVLDPVNPKKARKVTPVSAEIMNRGCHSGHSWKLEHRGHDARYPRGHFVCTKCGAREVRENY